MRIENSREPISWGEWNFPGKGKSTPRPGMYTFLQKCHSTSISSQDSDKRCMFLSKCQFPVPALIIKARSKIQARNCNFASKEFIISLYFKVPGYLFKHDYFLLINMYMMILIHSDWTKIPSQNHFGSHILGSFSKIRLFRGFKNNSVHRMPICTLLGII